ncbi:MAG: hypothetical protein FWD74_00615 [Actinomycetia bacterium]|nr:hypothetical protein [Actinomycetes bacterium]
MLFQPGELVFGLLTGENIGRGKVGQNLVDGLIHGDDELGREADVPVVPGQRGLDEFHADVRDVQMRLIFEGAAIAEVVPIILLFAFGVVEDHATFQALVVALAAPEHAFE